MATITDRQRHLVATVDVQTGAFTWVDRAAAPQTIRDLIDEPVILTMTGGPQVDGMDIDYVEELHSGTPAWAASLENYIPVHSDYTLEWHGP